MIDWIKRYDVRDGHEWAVVVADHKGFLGVVSSYGNYAFHWTDFGKDFKSFLLSIDEGYLVKKLTFGQKLHYDEAATLAATKYEIMRLRKEGLFTKPQARQEWELLGDFNDLYHQGDFEAWFQETSLLDASECYRSQRDPQTVTFAKTLWPKFKEALSADLNLQ